MSSLTTLKIQVNGFCREFEHNMTLNIYTIYVVSDEFQPCPAFLFQWFYVRTLAFKKKNSISGTG